FALAMNWLPWPVIVKAHGPKIVFKDKRAITWDEHQAIIAREPNLERKAFYQLAWHLGASQSDLAPPPRRRTSTGVSASSASPARKPEPFPWSVSAMNEIENCRV